MKRALITLLAVAGMLFVGATPAVATPPADMHCPDGGVKTETGDLNGFIATKGSVICVKAATANSGKIVADGVTTMLGYVTWKNNGGQTPDVSYYVIYSTPTPEPKDCVGDKCEPTPTPEPTPTVAPTPTPVPSPDPTPTPVPSESATPSAPPSVAPSPSDAPKPKPTTPPTDTVGSTTQTGGGIAPLLLLLAGISAASLLLTRKRA
jgi:outer membrane biosynthesis protein TonB